MRKSGFTFEFTSPDGWTDFRDGSRYVFQGPASEELIVSGFLIEGSGSDSDLEDTRQRLFRNAVASVERAAAHPELKVIKPLERDESTSAADCWKLSCVTTDGETMFEEAIFLGGRAVLLVTFEAPNTPAAKAAYKQFIRSVHSPPEG